MCIVLMDAFFYIKRAGVGFPCWHVMVEFECDNAKRAHLTEADDAQAAAQDGAGAPLASLVYSGYWLDCLDNPPTAKLSTEMSSRYPQPSKKLGWLFTKK